MGVLCYASAGNSCYFVPSAVKCVTYIAVGGGGGGARPAVPPNFGRTPSAGGTTGSYDVGIYGYGGGPGEIYSGGYGGYGNWRYGQRGYYSYGPGSRAVAGYGPYGTGGAGQWRSPSQSYGGGGGGASCCVKARGSSGAIPGQRVSWFIGSGGQQGGTGTCRYGASGAFYATVCTYDPPVPSISANPTSFRANRTDGNNGTSDLTWSTSGGETTSEILEAIRNGVVVESFGQVDRSRSSPFTVSPTQTTEYRLTVSNPGYTQTASVTVTVYQEPVVNFYADRETIFSGESTVLRWTTSGDANNMVVEPGIGSVSLSGFSAVSPSISTVYTATATGLGGTGSAQVYIEVLQPPTVFGSGPVRVNYGENIPVSVSATNSEGGVTLTPRYYFTDGTSADQPSILLPNSVGDEVEINPYNFVVNYGDFGPEKVTITLVVDGFGGLTDSHQFDVDVEIDQMPDVIDIPESDDTIRNEEPVVTPDVEVTTQQIVINDIDIPVEIKADYPIQVEINDSDNWQNVRQI